MEVATTKRQRDIIAHAINLEYRLKMRRQRRKVEEIEFRNYFCASFGSEHAIEIEKLVGMGLMRVGPSINDGKEFYAYVTEEGIKEVMP